MPIPYDDEDNTPFDGKLNNDLSVSGAITCGDLNITGALTIGTNPNPLSGMVCSFVGENTAAAVNEFYSYGDKSQANNGPTMAAPGKVIAMSFSSANNVLATIELYKNNAATTVTLGVVGNKNSTNALNHSFTTNDMLKIRLVSLNVTNLYHSVATYWVKFD